MVELIVPEGLWRAAVAPEGILEKWRAEEGSAVQPGQVLAEVRIEDALHELTAPAAGRLSIFTAQGCVIDPGAVIGRLEA